MSNPWILGCIVLGGLWLASLSLLLISRRGRTRLQAALARFQAIEDLEKHAVEQRALAEAAKEEFAQWLARVQDMSDRTQALAATILDHESQLADLRRRLSSASTLLGAYDSLRSLTGQIEKQKERANRYNQLLGNFKKAEDLKAHIEQQARRVQELSQTLGKFDATATLDRQIAAQRAQVDGLEARVRDLHEVLGGASSASELHARINYQQNLLAELQGKAQQVEEVLEMQEFGFYRPRYDFESSSQYQQLIDQVRQQQTRMVKADSAVVWEKKWIVEGSEAQGRKMMAEQTKLMLRAFNGECDAAIGKVKYNNAVTMENRIGKSCEQINKLGKTNSASVTSDFLRLKLQELHLVHEHGVKQQREKEEQQRIKEQIREEEKAEREIEQAKERAEREESLAEVALERARLAFERATQKQTAATEQTVAQNAALAAQVAKLEHELKEAIDRKAKAIARAQLTKSGHVYVLSNIGSFGEEVYKVGMTRRFEPLERVKELGDASVPFPFDVHAMIYSENAPALECMLHQHFSDRRVNLVNLRREYFRVTLDEVMEAVSEYFGVVTFVKVPQAAEFRETMAQRRADQGGGVGTFPMLTLPVRSRVPDCELEAATETD